MNPSLPKISILMPSYNQGLYLEAAIQSVLTQDYPDKELIVVDGGSTDSSPEIIRKYEAELAYSVSEKDRGQAHALNKALPHATGKIIGWLNSDDAYLPGAFSKIAQAMESHPEINVVHGNRIMIDHRGDVCGWVAFAPFDPAVTGYTICSETVFWRRKACSDQPFNESLQFAMDVDFFCRLYAPGRFLKLNDMIGAFRCHDASKSATIPETAHLEGRALWREIFPDIPEGWRNSCDVSWAKKMGMLLGHPRILAYPYLRYRIRRALGKRFSGITMS